jgi:mannose-6-phosphate isomerase-like protein (cupin superfamily)
MLSFLRPHVPRTNTATQNPLTFEDGASSTHFHNPSEAYMMTHTLPPDNIRPMDKQRTMFAPPWHYHIYQTESFKVKSGAARFFLRDKQFVVQENGTTHIPIGYYHKFENASKDEPLVIDIRLDEQVWQMEESFFRNFFGYLEDCRKASVEPSLFQLERFLYSMDVPLAIPVPGPEWLGRAVSWSFMVVTGVVVGEWMLGYKGSYPEYYVGEVDKKVK